MSGDRWQLGDTIYALFDAAFRNPRAGLNRAGRAIGKHCHGKLSAHKNLKRQGKRWSVATLEYQRKRDRERMNARYSGSV